MSARSSVPSVVLEGVRVENLRGYADASLSFGNLTFLVGNNNQGKSSVLRLVDWLLNDASDEVLEGRRPLSDAEETLFLPANKTAKRARRLSIFVRYRDGRKARPYRTDQLGIARLRLSVLKLERRLRLGVGEPRRSEDSQSAKRGLQLLREIRAGVRWTLIPPVRDAQAAHFRAGLKRRLQALLFDRFEAKPQQGAPKAYREANSFLKKVASMVKGSKDDLKGEFLSAVPLDLLRDVDLVFDATPEGLAKWLIEKVTLRMSTGAHDEDCVPAPEVGSGLQSTLAVLMAMAQSSDDSGKHIVIAIEEPEAFLHPSAQRALALQLRIAASGETRTVLVTTHSPYFLDESRFGEVCLVRNHRFFVPSADPERDAINTALMTHYAAEVFFAEGVLLVEGPGDAMLFDVLVRRVREKAADPRLFALTVREVGGKQRFTPWWRLFRSYGDDENRPIRWLTMMDGDAAAKSNGERAVIRALKDADMDLASAERADVEAFGNLPPTAKDLVDKAKVANSHLSKHSIRLLPVDLEWAAFGGYASVDAKLVASVLGVPVPTKDAPVELARIAGSRIKGKPSDPKKAPHLRAALARQMDLARLPPDLVLVLKEWIQLVMPPQDASASLAKAGIK